MAEQPDRISNQAREAQAREQAALAAYDAEIDAEDEEGEDALDETGTAQAQAEVDADDGDDTTEAEAEAEDAEAEALDEPPAVDRIRLTANVVARISACLRSQLEAIDAQIARAAQVSASDPFFERWKDVLLAQRQRCVLQLEAAEAAIATAPAAEAPVEVVPA